MGDFNNHWALFEKKGKLGLRKEGASFSIPLNEEAMRKLGFGKLVDSLAKQYNRQINFRIFDSESSARGKGKSYKLQL